MLCIASLDLMKKIKRVKLDPTDHELISFDVLLAVSSTVEIPGFILRMRHLIQNFCLLNLPQMYSYTECLYFVLFFKIFSRK